MNRFIGLWWQMLIQYIQVQNCRTYICMFSLDSSIHHHWSLTSQSYISCTCRNHMRHEGEKVNFIKYFTSISSYVICEDHKSSHFQYMTNCIFDISINRCISINLWWICVFPALYVLLQRMGCKEEASAEVLEHQRTAGVARLVLGAAVTMLPVLTFGASQA